MRKLIVSTVAAGVLALGGMTAAAFGTGVGAGAQEGGTTSTSPAAPGGPDAKGDGWRHRIRHRVRQALTISADTIGIERAALVAELRSGKSIAEVAEANGSSAQAVTEALSSKANARIDEAVADGKLTEERADRLRERLPEAIDRLVQRDWPGLVDRE